VGDDRRGEQNHESVSKRLGTAHPRGGVVERAVDLAGEAFEGRPAHHCHYFCGGLGRCLALAAHPVEHRLRNRPHLAGPPPLTALLVLHYDDRGEYARGECHGRQGPLTRPQVDLGELSVTFDPAAASEESAQKPWGLPRRRKIRTIR